MTDLLTLSTVNLDILLEIVSQDLGVHDLLNLRRTCKSLQAFSWQKPPWIALLQRFSRLRPLPLPPFRKLGTLSVPELTRIAVKASNLLQNWTSRQPIARPAFKMVAFPTTDVIVSVLFVPHTPYVLTLSVPPGMGGRHSNWITCVDTERGKVSRYRTQMSVSSWRAETMEEGAVIIALLLGPEDRSIISPSTPAWFQIIRLNLPNSNTYSQVSFHELVSHIITSPVIGMFLTSEIAGLVSVVQQTGASGLLMMRIRDGYTAFVDTGVPAQPKTNLNTIANHADLILYNENNLGASAYAYSFTDDLYPLFAPCPRRGFQRLVHVPPSTVQPFRFHPAELCEASNNVYTIIRTRWKDFTSGTFPMNRPRHSEISVLSMAFVIGADPSGINDHRCISHMYLDPFHPPEIDEEDEVCSCGMSSGSSSSAPSEASTPSSSSRHGTPDIQMHSHSSLPPSPSLSTSAALPASPTVVARSISDIHHHHHSSRDGTTKGDPAPIARRTFHSCLEEKKEIWQGPSRNDLISVGLGASHAIWLAAGEHGPELKLASFEEPPFPLPLRASPNDSKDASQRVVAQFNDGTQVLRAPATVSPRIGTYPPRAIRSLKLPMSINPLEISALALDDANGVVSLATMRAELWLLDYAVAPTS